VLFPGRVARISQIIIVKRASKYCPAEGADIIPNKYCPAEGADIIPNKYCPAEGADIIPLPRKMSLFPTQHPTPLNLHHQQRTVNDAF
jgi:hypothetical protein